MRRSADTSLGKMPTTRVRCLTSAITRSIMLLVYSFRRCSRGGSYTDMVSSNWSRIGLATLGYGFSQRPATRPASARARSSSGWFRAAALMSGWPATAISMTRGSRTRIPRADGKNEGRCQSYGLQWSCGVGSAANPLTPRDQRARPALHTSAGARTMSRRRTSRNWTESRACWPWTDRAFQGLSMDPRTVEPQYQALWWFWR